MFARPSSKTPRRSRSWSTRIARVGQVDRQAKVRLFEVGLDLGSPSSKQLRGGGCLLVCMSHGFPSWAGVGMIPQEAPLQAKPKEAAIRQRSCDSCLHPKVRGEQRETLFFDSKRSPARVVNLCESLPRTSGHGFRRPCSKCLGRTAHV